MCIRDRPTTAYTVSGTNITFTSAPATTDTFYGVALGEQLSGNTPSDSTITSAKLSGNLVTPGTLDLNGQELILDANANTSITADTDDQIDIKIAGADDFQFTANTFTVLSGSTLTIASGATIANSGTATGFSSADPSSADGDSLGTASAEWSDLYLADGGVIYFGNDQDVTVTHDPDDGLFLKSTATADNNPFLLTLQTGETDIAADDVIGKIAFQAPDEGTGTDAILVSAAIQAVAEGDHSSSSNATKLDFMTGASEAATTKMSLSSGGNLTITSTDAGAADGPILDLYRNSASPAGGDDIGAIRFSGENDAGTKDTLGAIRVDLDEPANGSEDSSMYFDIFQNGSAVTPLYFASSSNTAQVVLGHTGSVAQPSLTWTGDLNTGFYHDSGDSGVIRVSMNGTERQLWTNGGMVALSETSNANMTTGITINQGTAYNEMLAFKNSEVAHGVTGIMETDNFFYAGIYDSSTGGLRLESVSENVTAMWSRIVITNETTTDATNSTAAYYHIAATKSGTGKTPLADAANMIMWSNDGTGRVLFKGDGTVHASDTSWATSLDTEDDMKALRMLDKAQSTSGIITSAWDSMIGTDWEYLQKIGVAGSTHSEKGHPDMFSMQGIQKLTMGATWYLGQNFMAFLETMEKRMPGIRKEFEDHMLEQSGRPAMLTES